VSSENYLHSKEIVSTVVDDALGMNRVNIIIIISSDATRIKFYYDVKIASFSVFILFYYDVTIASGLSLNCRVRVSLSLN
jgi:hypothetical protein